MLTCLSALPAVYGVLQGFLGSETGGMTEWKGLARTRPPTPESVWVPNKQGAGREEVSWWAAPASLRDWKGETRAA